jgi:serine/threonine-protein kinase
MFAFELREAFVEATTSNISLSTLQTALAGRYAFERELGRGGMATVYLARDLTRNQYVAVKVLLPELAVTLGMERFLREIDVGMKLQHPRIVGVLDSGQADGVLYYVMPFVDGATLRDRLNREKQLSVDDTILITQQVADALAYAHSHGVIHRDIKPENILLDATGALVADFGIARAVSVAGGETLTRTGMAVGTPTYMSPEQAMGSKDVTPESDIYSLACVTYEMLAGQPPFTGPTAMALLARHSLDNVPSLKIVRGTVPDAVEDAIVRAMAKVPADRFRSATDFSAAMLDSDGAARRRRDSIRAKAIAADTVERPALGGGRKKMALIAAAVALPLVAAGGYFGWKAMGNGGAADTRAIAAAKNNIAVMYFDDRSPGKQMGYLADGITEALINELSAVKQLKVISRNGVAAFKGKPASDTIANILQVGTFVTGSVSPASGGKLKVDVQLVDASGKQLASGKVEQSPEKLLELQDSLAHEMSLLIREHVGKEIQELVSKAGTRNSAAWDALQRARQTIGEIDVLVRARDIPAATAKISESDSVLASVETVDKSWPQPIIERAWLAFRAARLIPATQPEFAATLDRGLAHADRALKLAPNDTGAIEIRGTLHYWQWLNNVVPNANAAALLQSAETDLRAATAANSATAYNALSHLLINKGDLNEAKLAAERAYNTDPYLTDVDRTIYRLFGAALDLALTQEATKWCTEGATRYPKNFLFTECKLWLYALPNGPTNISDAWKMYDSVVAAVPANRQEYYKLKGKMIVGIALVGAGKPDSAKAIAQANQDRKLDTRMELAKLAAIIYTHAGDNTTALEYYGKYLAANPQERAFAPKDKSWWLEKLRFDPRYQQLVKAN